MAIDQEQLIESLRNFANALHEAWKYIKHFFLKVREKLKMVPMLKAEEKTSRKSMYRYFLNQNFSRPVQCKSQVLFNKPRQIHARSAC